MPWFVSDVTPQDFSWTLDILAGVTADEAELDISGDDSKQENAAVQDPAAWFGYGITISSSAARCLPVCRLSPSEANEHLAPLVARWREHAANGTFSLRMDDFWTGFWPYWDLPQPLVDELNTSSGLVILKGDLKCVLNVPSLGYEITFTTSPTATAS